MSLAPFARPSTYEALGHQFVNVVIVTILDAGAYAAGPRGPQPVSDPALAEGRNASGRLVRGLAGVESVGEIVVLDLYAKLAGRRATTKGYSYPRSQPCFLGGAQSACSRTKMVLSSEYAARHRTRGSVRPQTRR
jgi:hypothetical protein